MRTRTKFNLSLSATLISAIGILSPWSSTVLWFIFGASGFSTIYHLGKLSND